MQLSIIIVNYNVKYFLEQCLCSVNKAITSLQAEIIVVDNNSTDNSVAYLQPKNPSVNFIVNKENVGFGKANNQALQIAKGQYILFLNPDTIVPEDCFIKCINFFENNITCGALGIKMIDGNGNFLPESKRSFPSVSISFFKLIGLASLFPKSKLFNRYALGFLDENNNHEVDVLAGAFFMAKKDLLVEVNGFDETFFMYGEDVDLSYRLQKLGYKNYYFSESSIIHFKGESTKRGSLNYVKMFYQAMSIFVSKHYSGSTATLFSFIIRIAIWVRAFISILSELITKWSFALLDTCIVFGSLWLVERNWVHYIRNGKDFNWQVVAVTIPSFTLLFLFAATVSGMYDNLYKPSKALLASASATIVLLAAYSLFPEGYRFSRGVILISGIVAGILITVSRWFMIQQQWIKETDEEKKFQQTIIVGSTQEYENVLLLLQQADLQERVLGRIKINGDNSNAIGSLLQLKTLLTNLNIKEIIFCEGTLSFQQIIEQIKKLPRAISFRFNAHNSNSIIGSDSKTTTGEIVTAEGFYIIAQPYQKRMKRMVDLIAAFIFLITFPIHILFIKNKLQFFINMIQILINKLTFVGYILLNKNLPIIKPAILTNYGLPTPGKLPLSEEALIKLDNMYAKNYDWLQDVKIIFEQHKNLGG